MVGPSASADFDAFYRATASRVIHVVYVTTGDLGLAQDCAQEAYARAWQRWETLGAYGEPVAWVRTVARRLAISQWRSRQAEHRAVVRSYEPRHPSHADHAVDSVAVHTALATLPVEQREALALFYIADQSIEQIARELDTPVGTIKARLHRGRAALSTRLHTTTSTGEEPRR